MRKARRRDATRLQAALQASTFATEGRVISSKSKKLASTRPCLTTLEADEAFLLPSYWHAHHPRSAALGGLPAQHLLPRSLRSANLRYTRSRSGADGYPSLASGCAFSSALLSGRRAASTAKRPACTVLHESPVTASVERQEQLSGRALTLCPWTLDNRSKEVALGLLRTSFSQLKADA